MSPQPSSIAHRPAIRGSRAARLAEGRNLQISEEPNAKMLSVSRARQLSPPAQKRLIAQPAPFRAIDAIQMICGIQ